MRRYLQFSSFLAVLAGVLVLSATKAAGQTSTAAPTLPTYLKDRGTGVPSSQFGIYIRRGDLILYPYFEYYRDGNLEYNPAELGAQGEIDFRGRYRASEGLFFLGYGLTDDLAVELEVAGIKASFEKSAEDTSALPERIDESGLGDIEAQLRWRWRRETASRPELFSYFEVVFPHDKDKVLIGTPGWELKVGTGVVRGFGWGTLTVRASLEYDEASDSPFDIGEYAVEYLKRASDSWRFYVAVEGTSDEVELITEAQWHLTPHVYIKLNNAVGLSSKAPDWAPEIGILFTIPTR